MPCRCFHSNFKIQLNKKFDFNDFSLLGAWLTVELKHGQTQALKPQKGIGLNLVGEIERGGFGGSIP